MLMATMIVLYSPMRSGDSHVLALEATPHSYKAITYNIHSGKDADGRSSLAEIAHVLQQEQADFIALQEVDRRRLSSGVQDQITILANSLQMEYAFSPAMRTGIAQYGNAILSRYPILASGTLDLSGGREHRTLVWAKVYTENGSLYLTSVHLDTNRASRSEHFTQMSHFVQTELADAPVLMMGDFNTLFDHADMVRFQQDIGGKYDAYEVPTFFHSKANRAIQIDYIFGRSIVGEEYYTIATNASDHLPLVFVFTIGKLPYKDFDRLIRVV